MWTNKINSSNSSIILWRTIHRRIIHYFMKEYFVQIFLYLPQFRKKEEQSSDGYEKEKEKKSFIILWRTIV